MSRSRGKRLKHSGFRKQSSRQRRRLPREVGSKSRLPAGVPSREVGLGASRPPSPVPRGSRSSSIGAVSLSPLRPPFSAPPQRVPPPWPCGPGWESLPACCISSSYAGAPGQPAKSLEPSSLAPTAQKIEFFIFRQGKTIFLPLTNTVESIFNCFAFYL